MEGEKEEVKPEVEDTAAVQPEKPPEKPKEEGEEQEPKATKSGELKESKSVKSQENLKKTGSKKLKDQKPSQEVVISESKTRQKDTSASVLKGSKDEVQKKSEISVGKKASTVTPLDRKESEFASIESLGRRTRSLVKDESAKGDRRSERLSVKAKNVLGSTISIRRLSTIGEFYDRTKGARFMNTYKLDSDNPFNPDKVTRILEAVMTEALENLTYDPDKCPKQAKWASSVIRTKVKELQFDRYKLICLVTIGEKNSQDVFVSCRFLWDVDRDRYATYSIENTYVFGIAQCFGVYYE